MFLHHHKVAMDIQWTFDKAMTMGSGSLPGTPTLIAALTHRGSCVNSERFATAVNEGVGVSWVVKTYGPDGETPPSPNLLPTAHLFSPTASIVTSRHLLKVASGINEGPGASGTACAPFCA